MKKIDYLFKSLLHAFATLAYVVAVVWVMSHGEDLFGGDGQNLIGPVFALLLFVVSAAITGFLVVGKPLYLYFNKKPKEALILFVSTVGWLILFLLLTAVIIAF